MCVCACVRVRREISWNKSIRGASVGVANVCADALVRGASLVRSVEQPEHTERTTLFSGRYASNANSPRANGCGCVVHPPPQNGGSTDRCPSARPRVAAGREFLLRLSE